MRKITEGRAQTRGGRGLLLGGVALLGAVAACRGSEDGPTGPQPTAVVLVTIDTLRADGVSFLGSSLPTSPFLDDLAAEGIVFTQAYAPSSWTAPSMASLFTGLEPAAHGVVSGFVGKGGLQEEVELAVKNQPLLPQSLLTMAESFRAAGYVTIGVPSNLHLAQRLGFAQGFDYYFAEASFLDAPDVNLRVWEQLELAFGPDWRTDWKREKTFLWIHYFDPHAPYSARTPWIEEHSPEFAANPADFPAGWDLPRLKRTYPRPGPEIGARLVPLYRSEVRYVDEHLRMLDEEIGIRDDDVLLVMTSDHGEEFAEHGQFGHGHTLFEEVLRVPLLLHWPAGFPAAKRVEVPVSILDIFPTLAQLLNLRAPSGIQGAPLRGVTEEPSSNAVPMYFHTDRARPSWHAIRQGSWKLIHAEGKPSMLFDLAKDPTEREPVSARHPEIVQRLERALAKHLAALPAPPDDAGHVPVTNQEDLDKLRDLGYGE